MVADAARRRAGAGRDGADVRPDDAREAREVLPPAAVAEAPRAVAAADAMRLQRRRRGAINTGRAAGPRPLGGGPERVRVDGIAGEVRQSTVRPELEDLVEVDRERPAEALSSRALVAVVQDPVLAPVDEAPVLCVRAPRVVRFKRAAAAEPRHVQHRDVGGVQPARAPRRRGRSGTRPGVYSARATRRPSASWPAA